MKTNSKKLQLKGTWTEVKGKIKKKYAHLTDNDLLYDEGREEELLGRLQRKIGRSRTELKEWIESL
jgi:uncharacterized protein YjbJ (UPF0337 family)